MYNICLGLIFSSVVNETFFFLLMLSLFRSLSVFLSLFYAFSPMYSPLSVCLSNLYRFMSLTLQIGGLILFFLRYSAQLRAFIIFYTKCRLFFVALTNSTTSFCIATYFVYLIVLLIPPLTRSFFFFAALCNDLCAIWVYLYFRFTYAWALCL